MCGSSGSTDAALYGGGGLEDAGAPRVVGGNGRFIQKNENRYWDPVFIRNGRLQVHRGKFGSDVSNEFAVDFLRRNRERPFLLYLRMTLTHGETFTQPVIPTPVRQRLQRVLDGLPSDASEPFLLRSQSGFKLRNEARAKAK